MTPAEVTMLLTAAKAIDDRVNYDRAKAAAWHSIIDETIPLDFARLVLTRHYSERTDAIMPAHFNQAWAGEKRAIAAREATQARLAEMDRAALEACPPPPEFRQMVARLQGRAS